MMEIGVLILNINNLEFTKSLLDDLDKQTDTHFHVTLVDQNSYEEATDEFLNEIESDRVTLIKK